MASDRGRALRCHKSFQVVGAQKAILHSVRLQNVTLPQFLETTHRHHPLLLVLIFATGSAGGAEGNEICEVADPCATPKHRLSPARSTPSVLFTHVLTPLRASALFLFSAPHRSSPDDVRGLVRPPGALALYCTVQLSLFLCLSFRSSLLLSLLPPCC